MILQPHYQLALSQLWIKTLQTAGKAIDGTIAPFKRMNFTKSSGRRKNNDKTISQIYYSFK